MTTITGREVMDVMQKFGELAWGKCGGINGIEDNLKYPPVIVWRFKESQPGLELTIKKAVESFKGNVEWEIQFTGRNWVIAPKRVREFQEQRGYRVDVESLSALANEEPDFGREANEDLPGLAEKIKKIINVTLFLESDDFVAVRVRKLLKDKSLQEMAAQLEKCLSSTEESQRLYDAKNVLASGVTGGSYRDSGDEIDEIDEIDLLDLAEELVEKLAIVMEKYD
jgi:hypothetical protein